MIPDEQITYSYSLLGPGAGRLDGVEWQTDEWYPWLQVDLGSLPAVSGVQIQPCSSTFVTSVRIKYGETNNTLSYFMDDDGDPKVRTIYSKKMKWESHPNVHDEVWAFEPVPGKTCYHLNQF